MPGDLVVQGALGKGNHSEALHSVLVQNVMKVVRYCNTTKENTQQVASLLSSAGVI
jgi:hypothetical protein